MTPDEVYVREVERLNAQGPNIIESEKVRTAGYELSDRDLDVFGIHPGLQWALHLAHVRYEALNGTVTGSVFSDVAVQDRKDWSEFVLPQSGDRYDECQAALFMHRACGLSYSNRLAWVMKLFFQGQHPGRTVRGDREDVLCMRVDETGKAAGEGDDLPF